MNIETPHTTLRQHPFFAGLDEEYLALISKCGKYERRSKGSILFREGTPADWFFVVRKGRIALDVHTPGHGALVVQTVEADEVLGWSWLFPPYTWTLTARVVEDAALLSMDGACLRKKCDNDPRLGYTLMQRFARVMADRLLATRLQVLDVYGSQTKTPPNGRQKPRPNP